MNDIPLWVLYCTLGLCLLASAFFSGSETSMMAINRYRLRHLAQSGHRGASLTHRLLLKTESLLAVVLLGNTLVNAAAAAITTVIAQRLFGQDEWILLAATLLLTFVTLIFSESTPKIVGAAFPEKIAFPSSYVLTLLLRLLSPVVWVINVFVRNLLRLARIRTGGEHDRRLTADDLRILVLEAANFMGQKHHSMLLNLLELEAITVDDVMVPRHQIEVVDLAQPLEALQHQIATCHHTRLPVVEGGTDNVLGMVHARKLLQLSLDELTAATLQHIMREPYYIPVGTPLLTQLNEFQRHQRRIGLVVDEYGEIQGLVTLEDILEELVGEFTTAAPSQRGEGMRQDDGSLLVEGRTTLRTMNRKWGMHFPLEGPKTLSGLIIEHLEDIPEAGTCVRIAGLGMEIMQTQNRSVKMVRIYPSAPDDESHS